MLELLRKYGRNVYSFEALEPDLKYWWHGDDAAVAYDEAAGWRVAVGAPICRRERLAEVARAFADDARAHGSRAVFFGVSDRMIEVLPQASAWDWVQIGMQPSWNPRTWKQIVRDTPDLRRRLRRAAKAGVTVREVAAAEMAEGTSLRARAEALLARWQGTHRMPPMRFMVTVDLFTAVEERRYFIAEQQGELVGLLAGVPIYGRGGWLLDDLLVVREGAPGTSEALIDLAMSRLGDEGVEYVSLGLVALAGLDRGAAPPCWHPILELAFNFSLRSLNGLYSFHGIYAFRQKLKPTAWEPVYMAAHGRVHVFTLLAVLEAFAGGSLADFATAVAARQIAEGAARVPRLFEGLALGMGAWTALLLAHPDLFGGRRRARAWAAFDLAQAAGLVAVGQAADPRERASRARRAGWVAAADVGLTLLQQVLDPPRPRGWLERAMTVASVAGPALLAVGLGLYARGTES